MKNVKVIAAAFLLSVFAANSAQAQEKPALTPEQKQQMIQQNKENRDRLGLTKEQQTPYREIIKRYAQLVREVRASGLTTEAKREKLAVLLTEKNAEMKTLLTPEQFKTYEQIQEERKAKFVQLRK